uniref:Uncharacterized protein n=1 Tax=viral metagenome TaxID=1070528 RepID=A0A6C0EB37_9ZZZZ
MEAYFDFSNEDLTPHQEFAVPIVGVRMAIELCIMLITYIESEDDCRSEFVRFISMPKVIEFLAESPHLSHLRRKFVKVEWEEIAIGDAKLLLANAIAHVLDGTIPDSENLVVPLTTRVEDGGKFVDDLSELKTNLLSIWRNTLPNNCPDQEEVDDVHYITETTCLLRRPSVMFAEDQTVPPNDFCFDLFFTEFENADMALCRRLVEKYDSILCCHAFLKNPEYVDLFCTEIHDIRDKIDEKVDELGEIIEELCTIFPTFRNYPRSILTHPCEYYFPIVRMCFDLELQD